MAASPPSSFAITTTLPSCTRKIVSVSADEFGSGRFEDHHRTPDRWAIEELELPNDIPIAYCSTSSGDVDSPISSLILN